ncbi:MAG TPA: SDR family oxidoreductase [Woeseiaceae bacterium]|jgi:NAD(P)-dependent dehydrogenase (short-subunit alcohol dehydrogenase family)|nr:SDR family oxidoreductase [Woeseiaceae bacterium]|tara:strand:- start:32 stop:739 length:708 start_codon:yes stop_codon:yes gene_type:complete
MKTVLVTGANRGIGLEFVRQYSSEGNFVIAVSRTDDDIGALNSLSKDRNVRIEIADVSDFLCIDVLSEKLKDFPIDIIINNAGLFGPKAMTDNDLRQSFGHMDYDIWRKILNINTLAPFKITESFIEHLRAGSEKKVVTISSSVASLLEAESGINAYRTSKCAVNMVMASLAKELKEEGIKIGIYCPGWVSTRMGGEKAPITPKISVSGMRKLIIDLTLDKSGAFYRYNGEQIPW